MRPMAFVTGLLMVAGVLVALTLPGSAAHSPAVTSHLTTLSSPLAAPVRTASPSGALTSAAPAASAGVSTAGDLLDPTIAAPAGTHESSASTAAAAPSAPPVNPSAANSWAVVIGIEHYDGDTHPTYGGEGDASAFMRLLTQAGWPSSHILELVDGQATGANIRGAMSWLVAHSSPNSFTVFHYSGHVCEQGRGPCSNPDKFLWSVDNQLISNAEFGQTMRGLQGWSWIDIAGCEAAAFDQGLSSPQRFFTGSSMANETSYEVPDWHESVWTGLVVDEGILQRQAATGSGPVSIQAAVRWAQARATQMTANQPAGAQHPYAVGGTGEWFIAPNTAPPGQAGPSGGSGSSPAPSKGSPPPQPQSQPNRCPSITKSILTC